MENKLDNNNILYAELSFIDSKTIVINWGVKGMGVGQLTINTNDESIVDSEGMSGGFCKQIINHWKKTEKEKYHALMALNEIKEQFIILSNEEYYGRHKEQFDSVYAAVGEYYLLLENHDDEWYYDDDERCYDDDEWYYDDDERYYDNYDDCYDDEEYDRLANAEITLADLQKEYNRIFGNKSEEVEDSDE